MWWRSSPELAGIADRAAYNASKHGLIGLSRTLAAGVASPRRALQCCLPGMGQRQKWTRL